MNGTEILGGVLSWCIHAGAKPSRQCTESRASGRYAESDTLNSVADALRGIGWNAWANPVKNVVDQLLQSGVKAG